jgi:hypothetical protein
MKITKNQLRRIIKEEKAKLLRENMEDLPPPEIRSRTKLGPGNYNPGTDAMIVMDAVEYAITDALDEELGITPDQLDALREEVMRRKDLLNEAIKNGFESYERKLGMMGGRAKPRGM